MALIEAFRSSAELLGINCKIIGTDINPLSPALYVCDYKYVAPKITSRSYVDFLVDICRKHRVGILIPTIDTELMVLARNKSLLKEETGTVVLISSPEVIRVCQDKRETYRFLKEHNFGTPKTFLPEDVAIDNLKFPLFLKPYDGSASRGNARVNNIEEYKYFVKRIPNCIVQEYIRGQEYTCDVYVDFKMRVRCVVPRKRIEVRAGEVSKAQTVKNENLIKECKRLVEVLGAGPGMITIQGFLTPRGKVKLIEINPRFGGGVPLSIKAGADFPRWILLEFLGGVIRPRFSGWKENLYMLRYDEAVWITKCIGKGKE